MGVEGREVTSRAPGQRGLSVGVAALQGCLSVACPAHWGGEFSPLRPHHALPGLPVSLCPCLPWTCAGGRGLLGGQGRVIF